MTIGTRFADGGASHWSTIALRDWPAKGWKHLLEDKVDRREMDVKAVRSDIESSGCEFKLFGCWNEQSHVTYASFGNRPRQKVVHFNTGSLLSPLSPTMASRYTFTQRSKEAPMDFQWTNRPSVKPAWVAASDDPSTPRKRMRVDALRGFKSHRHRQQTPGPLVRGSRASPVVPARRRGRHPPVEERR